MRLNGKFLIFLLCASAVFAQPHIGTVSPNAGQQGTNQDVFISGGWTTNWVPWVQGSTTVNLGEGITVNSVTVFSHASLRANFSIAANAALGARNVTVTTGSEIVNRANAFTVTAGIAAVINVTPNIGQQGTNLNVAITGQFTHWAQGRTTVITENGARATVNSVTVSSATSLTANISILVHPSWGGLHLTVTTGDEIVTVAGKFTVELGKPVITSVNPNTGKRGTSLSVTITGQFAHWAPGDTTVNLGEGITVNSVRVSGDYSPTWHSSLTASISIARNAALGARNLTVTRSNTIAKLANAFTVTEAPPPPVITSVNPNTGEPGTFNQNVTITGQFTNWTSYSTRVNLGEGITVFSVTVNSANSLTANIAISQGAVLGPRNLTVTTSDVPGETVNLVNAFTVKARPVIPDVNPRFGQQGTNNLNVAITGQYTNWVQGRTSVNLGAGITVNSVTVSSATSLTANISIAASAPRGARDLTVTAGDELVNRAFAFTVEPATPVITSVNPNTGQQGAKNLNVAITGQYTNWVQGSTTVVLGGQTVNSVTVHSPTSLTANISIFPYTIAGSKMTLVVDGATLPDAFTVSAGTPVITSVNPNNGQAGTNNLNVVIAGQYTSNWVYGGSPTVNLGAGITVNSVTAILTSAWSDASLTANISIAANAAVGVRNLTVTTGSEVVGLANAFTVTPPSLLITTSSLSSGTVGAMYSAGLAATGGTPGYTWSIISGALPGGLSLNSSTGVISGTPILAGTFNFTTRVTDNASAQATVALSITTSTGTLTINTPNSLPNGTAGVPYLVTFSVSGGTPSFSWLVTAGSLPTGLSLSSGGAISGTPTTPGTSTVTVTVTDADNLTASRQLSITVNRPPVSGGTVTGIPVNPQPQEQLNLNVVLPSPYTLDVRVALTLTFASEVGGDDQTIQFSTGGRTATLTIPAGQTQAPSSVWVQTGTVAGTITIAMAMRADGMDVTPQPPPQATITIPRGVPVLSSLQIQRTETGLNLTAIGHTATRSATQAMLTFKLASGSNPQTTNIPVDVSAAFATYFGTAGSNATGGQFRLVLPLNITEDQTAIQSISMTLSNASGASQPASALVP